MRLLEEAFDWCVLNSRFVSAVRLRNLLGAADEPTRRSFGAFAATVRAQKRVSWPGEGSPLSLRVTGRSEVPDLRRPALQQLRLRAILGVSARAEIIRWMLPEPSRFFGVTDLANRTAYGKDNIADALEMFSLAGILTRTTMTTAGNQKLFRLDAGAELVAIAGAATPCPEWAARFRLLLGLVAIASDAPDDRAARGAAVYAFLQEFRHDLARVGTFPHLGQGVEAVNDDFDRWSTGALRSWAGLDATPR
ncbi:MAG TPA: hypothetical protein VNG93_13290 [Candidatus Dormibacteraeota bacterium]|nr:hypothetical protein [Candidatus Dormibacteraeota bacterium]